MTAGVLALSLLGASAATAEDAAGPLVLVEGVGLLDDEAAALEAAVAEPESIGARLRRVRAARAARAWWPRLSLAVSWTGGGPARLARVAATPDALDLGSREGLAWSIVATWGSQ